MDYYELPIDKRWLGDHNNPNEIGGRSTDVSQIGLSIEAIIKSLYPINGVPQEIQKSLQRMKSALEISDDLIREFINLVSSDVMIDKHD